MISGFDSISGLFSISEIICSSFVSSFVSCFDFKYKNIKYPITKVQNKTKEMIKIKFLFLQFLFKGIFDFVAFLFSFEFFSLDKKSLSTLSD